MYFGCEIHEKTGLLCSPYFLYFRPNGKVESNTLKMSVFGSAYFCIKYAFVGALCKKKDSIIAIV